jgi:hypothetical protein
LDSFRKRREREREREREIQLIRESTKKERKRPHAHIPVALSLCSSAMVSNSSTSWPMFTCHCSTSTSAIPSPGSDNKKVVSLCALTLECKHRRTPAMWRWGLAIFNGCMRHADEEVSSRLHATGDTGEEEEKEEEKTTAVDGEHEEYKAHEDDTESKVAGERLAFCRSNTRASIIP